MNTPVSPSTLSSWQKSIIRDNANIFEDLKLDTYFALPQRTNDAKLASEIEIVSQSPVISGLLRSVSGLLAILDENRQIIAINDSFLKLLGIDDPEETLGLRPGEALQCVHANDEPAGCGTTKYCSTCGAAIAIVSSLGQSIPYERVCALSANRGGRPVDMAFLVRSQPIEIESKKFILLFLQDITRQEQRTAFERTFYHDINNMLNMLVQASELLIMDVPSKLAANIHQVAFRLVREVAIQRALSDDSVSSYHPMWDEFPIDQIYKELISLFESHPSAKGKNINFPDVYQTVYIKTDICLLLRVLSNMVINALEATEKNGIIKAWPEHGDDWVSFCVWNSQTISQEISNRIFQRNFSTKGESGRGIGTYSMKLFGERILGGTVTFTSSEDDGTVFRYTQKRRS